MKLAYRPEIDGLRAIAVLAVIIYHLDIILGDVKLLKGGFLGVDIFFVISGYLITTIIMSEYHSPQGFSLVNFYERRARRLLPALFTVILVSLPVAWYLLLPSQLEDFAKSVLSTLAFGSNFYWHFSLQEYGAESAQLKPFLHTWTLAVEEQYYIFFPLILLAIYKCWKSQTVVILLVLLLLSLLFAEYMTPVDHSFSFYMLPTRFWELLAGGLLASIHYYRPREENENLLNKIMPVLGLVLIVYSMFFVGFESNHPGFITLLPVVGAALIIWFSSKDELVTKVLSSKLFVGVGLISYALYLWHYPIFAFGRVIDSTPTWHVKTQWLLLTFIFSFASYVLIERPFRNRKVIKIKVFLLAATLSATIILSAALGLVHAESSDQLQEVDFRAEKLKRFDWDGDYEVCHPAKEGGFDHRGCNIAGDKKNILVVGDSMAPDAARIVGNNFPNHRYILSNCGGCVPMTPKQLSEQVRVSKRLEKITKIRYSKDALNGIDAAIIMTLMSSPEYIDSYVRNLKENGISKIIIFGNYLKVNDKVSDYYFEHKNINILEEVIRGDLFTEEEFVSYDEAMMLIAEKYSIDFISIKSHACPTESECPIFIEGKPFSWDRQHYSVEFSDYLSKVMRNTLTNTWLGSL
ncbi:MAG TPA: acyltransferase [Cellvibrionaceae bacterium]